MLVLDTLDAINSWCKWIRSSVIALPTDVHHYLLRGYFPSASAFVLPSGVSVPMVECCNVFRSKFTLTRSMPPSARYSANSCASRQREFDRGISMHRRLTVTFAAKALQQIDVCGAKENRLERGMNSYLAFFLPTCIYIANSSLLRKWMKS